MRLSERKQLGKEFRRRKREGKEGKKWHTLSLFRLSSVVVVVVLVSFLFAVVFSLAAAGNIYLFRELYSLLLLLLFLIPQSSSKE